MPMQSLNRAFGATGATVPALGFGAAAAGDPTLSEAEAGALLNGAVDAGATLIDTARSYGLSEERIGRHLSHRRRELVLSTKVGYGVPGRPDWTGPAVEAGIDLALGNLQTDVIDIVHLHSCPSDVLRRGEVVGALVREREAGKIRVAAYSGDGDALDLAVDSGHFGGIQTSVNVCDLASEEKGTVARAVARGMGVLAKRPLANAPWARTTPPAGDEAAAAYFHRWNRLAHGLGGLEPAEVALRFAAYAPGIAAAIVGTRSLARLSAHLAAVARGPLPEALENALLARWRERGAGWPGMI
jgi:aryl-alcohol dehydrogenase-like predicted oxidoreductase